MTSDEKRISRLIRIQIVIAIIAAVLTIGAAVTLGTMVQKRETLRAEIAEMNDLKSDLQDEIRKLEEDKRTLAAPAAMSFGYKEAQGLEPGRIDESLKADREVERLETATPGSQRSETIVQYFTKNLDKAANIVIVMNSLEEYGFTVTSNENSRNELPTNAVWFGEDVEISDVRLVAYTLIRAGIEIRYIGPYSREVPATYARRIQVGATPRASEDPIWAVDMVRTVDRFEGAVPEDLWTGSLVRQMNDESLDRRTGAFRNLVKEHADNRSAVDSALTSLQGPNLESLSANGRINTLLFLVKTEPAAWTAGDVARARRIIETMRERDKRGIARIGRSTGEAIHQLEAHLDAVSP